MIPHYESLIFQMIIDGTLHKELRARFLRDSLSVCELKRILKVTLLHKLLECEDFGSDIATNAGNVSCFLLM